MHQPTRKLAREAGDMYYDSGEDCKQGHSKPLRYTSSGRCLECYKESAATTHPKTRYSPILRFQDGTVEFLGPFVNKSAAMSKYIQRHIEVYGHPPPHLNKEDYDD